MRINSKWLAGLIFIIVFGGISLSAIPGWWRTESSKIPKEFSTGEFSGTYNPADIRGSYTFGDVSNLFNIPLVDLQNAFLLSETDPSIVKLKDLEVKFAEASANGMEIGTGSVQLFVATYLGLPIVTDEEYLPAPAVNILKQKGNLTTEQVTYLDNHSVPVGTVEVENKVVVPVATEVPATNSTESSVENVETSVNTIKGSTTFRELLDWGVPEEKISAILGQPMPNPLLTIKDFCLDNGLEFGTLKTELQLEIP